MTTPRQTVKIVRIGDRQTIQLPPGFELEGKQLPEIEDLPIDDTDI